MRALRALLRRWAPKSFTGQTLATTIAVLFLAQMLTIAFFSIFVLLPQVERVAGIAAQSVAAATNAAELATPEARQAIIASLDASDYLDVWPGDTPPPAETGPRPRALERWFMRALSKAVADRSELQWRTDAERRLWIQVRIGPELYWFSARSPTAMQPLLALVASGVATFLLALFAVVVLQGRLGRPLEELTAAVESVGATNAAPRVAERGPHELKVLAARFNAMSARLEAADQERAILLAGVSHDVRTPLAKLRLAIELLAGESELASSAHAQVREIDRILSKFLTFARGFEAEAVVRFDLDALISEVAAVHAADDVAFAIEGERLGLRWGRPEALRRALLNLTENARRHGAAPFAIGGRVFDDAVEIYVRDAGAGLEPGALQRLVRPFVRGEAATGGGSGLGLAIAERVAAIHGGALSDAQTPQGYEVRLRVGLGAGGPMVVAGGLEPPTLGL